MHHRERKNSHELAVGSGCNEWGTNGLQSTVVRAACEWSKTGAKQRDVRNEHTDLQLLLAARFWRCFWLCDWLLWVRSKTVTKPQGEAT